MDDYRLAESARRQQDSNHAGVGSAGGKRFFLLFGSLAFLLSGVPEISPRRFTKRALKPRHHKTQPLTPTLEIIYDT
jgi:hypothetical protein